MECTENGRDILLCYWNGRYDGRGSGEASQAPADISKEAAFLKAAAEPHRDFVVLHLTAYIRYVTHKLLTNKGN